MNGPLNRTEAIITLLESFQDRSLRWRSFRNATVKQMLLFSIVNTSLLPASFSQSIFLKAEIKAPKTALPNRDFPVATAIRNMGTAIAILHVSQCWHSDLQWTSDTPAVHVVGIPCKKNRLFDLLLKPDEATEGDVRVHISLSEAELVTPRTVTFRLGFITTDDISGEALRSHLPDSGRSHTIWSNLEVVTVRVGK